MHYIKFLAIIIVFAACRSSRTTINETGGSQIFWGELQKLCGKSFEGEVIAAPANDTAFRNKKLVMHVRSCDPGTIRIPFMVGENRSRTWVITKQNDRLQLKHDHRHQDGKEDSVTQYGGVSPNSGSAILQMFPADQATVNILPAAAINVWWIELVPNKYFTYNLRRMGTDRYFSVRFDLTREVSAPPAPWGW